MKRQLNVKLLLSLILVVGVVGGAVHALHGALVRRSAATLLRRAEQVRHAGKWAEELDFLKRYLAYRPDDSDALERSGLILARAQSPEDRTQGLAILEKLLAREPGRSQVRRLAADLARGLGQVDAARAHYEILAHATPAGDAAAEAALGRFEEELKRYAEAVAWYEKAIAHAPERVDLYPRIAHLVRVELKKPDQGDRIMDAREVNEGVIAHNPQSAQAYLDRAAYRREFAIPGASADIKQAQALAPADTNVLLAAAGEAAPDEAIRLLSRGIELDPANPQLYEKIAVAELNAGRRPRAIDRLKAGVDRLPANINLQGLLTELQIDEGNYADAVAGIKRLRATKLPAVMLDLLDSRILVDSRQWSQASRELSRIAPTLAAIPTAKGLTKRAFLMLARCEHQLDNADRRYDAARRAVAVDVANPPLALAARVELASALSGMGRLDEAAEEYRDILRMPAAPAALRLDLCRVLATRTIRLPAKHRQWDEVNQSLNDPTAAPPDSAELAILRAEVLAAQGGLDLANERLEQAKRAYPRSAPLEVARAALARRRGDASAALTILEAARQTLGDQPELLAALVGSWAATPDEAAGRKLRDLLPAASALSNPAARWATLDTLARGFDRVGDQAEAKAIRDRLATEQPDHLGVRLAQLDAAFRANDLDDAGRVLGEVQRIEGPEGAIWRYGRAQVLIAAARRTPDPASLDQASVLLGEARQRRPGWTRATLAAAEVDDLRGDAAAALRAYLAAIEGGEHDPRALRRAVELLYRQGRFTQANTLLAQATQDAPMTPELGRLAADLALQAQDDARAIDLARRAVASQASSAADQTWLGQLLLAAARQAENRLEPVEARRRRVEAEQALRRGVELAPTDPDARVALVVALAGSGQIDEAQAAVRAADGQLKGPAGELALARCFEAVGQTDQAEARLRALMQTNPDDPTILRAAATMSLRAGKVVDAESTLRRLIALSARYPGEAAWAKRTLALALASGGPGGAFKARELLGMIEGSTTGSVGVAGPTDVPPEDLRTRAQVLSRQPGRAARRQAIALVDMLAARDEAKPEDLFLRAQLLAADGDWKRARALGVQLLDENPSNAAILVFLARGQIASSAPDEAAPWIDALARRNMAPTLVTELRARLWFATGKATEAIALLAALVRNNPQLGPGAAALLEEAKRPDDAESLLRSVDPKGLAPEVRVNQSLALAALLGRNGRHADAITICQQLWTDPTVAPARVSAVALAALYTGHPEDAVLDRVASGIEGALQRQPHELSLRFDKANLLILRGQYAEAEAILRALHQSQPQRGAPLNNLAWLLALRGGGRDRPLDLIDRAIVLEGSSPELLDTRGLILTQQGQPERAVDDLSESVAATPAPLTFFHLALALHKAGRATEAAEALAKARSSGLRPSDIHPLERPGYLALAAALPGS